MACLPRVRIMQKVSTAFLEALFREPEVCFKRTLIASCGAMPYSVKKTNEFIRPRMRGAQLVTCNTSRQSVLIATSSKTAQPDIRQPENQIGTKKGIILED